MTASTQADGLAGAFMAHRDKLLRFLLARGAGDAAEDLLQEVWLRITTSSTGPVAAPLPYLFRIADLLMIDRFRSARQAALRKTKWHEVSGGVDAGVSEAPSAAR
ncbi:MAG: RNA polymerase sigma factor, partial [Erythrobacter sp.]